MSFQRCKWVTTDAKKVFKARLATTSDARVGFLERTLNARGLSIYRQHQSK